MPQVTMFWSDASDYSWDENIKSTIKLSKKLILAILNLPQNDQNGHKFWQLIANEHRELGTGQNRWWCDGKEQTRNE